MRRAFTLLSIVFVVTMAVSWVVLTTKEIGNMATQINVLEQRVNILSPGELHGKIALEFDGAHNR